MEIRKGVYGWAGKDVDLTGPELKAGAPAPDFDIIDAAGETVGPGAAKGQVLIIATMPSVDTPVCDLEMRRLFKEAPTLPSIAILVATTDLPFAQQRWAKAAELGEQVKLASDHRTGSMGAAYGVLDAERRLLARAIFVLDRQGILRHVEYCRSAGDQPNIDKVVEVARSLLAE